MIFDDLIRAWPFLLMVIGAALLAIFAFAFTSDIGARFKVEITGWFFAAVPLTLVASTLILNRKIVSEGSNALANALASAPEIGDYAATNWFSRALTLVVMVIAFERASRFVLQRQYRDMRGAGLLAAMLVYVICSNLLAPLFGTKGGFSHQLLYAPILMLAMFAHAQHGMDQSIKIIRGSLTIFLLVSILAIPIIPDMVVDRAYGQGVVGALKLRFYGFATHPNTLAPLCFVLMCILVLKPFSRKVLNLAVWALAAVCLLLTQSKTSILIAIVLMSGLMARGVIARAKGTGAANGQRSSMVLLMVVAFVAAFGLGLLLYLVMVDSKVTHRLVAAFDAGQFATLSGRTLIWAETLRVVDANPLFGYGPGLWGPEFIRNGGLRFSHSHNQYLQTLGTSGIVGLLGLILYLLALLTVAWRVRAATSGISVVMVIYLIMRGLTEVPLSVTAAMHSEFMIQMFVIGLCVAAMPKVAPRLSLPRYLGRSSPVVSHRRLVNS